MSVVACVTCGSSVNAEAAACPACGSDPRTGDAVSHLAVSPERAAALAETAALEDFMESPAGQARAAREAGLHFFQIPLPLLVAQRSLTGMMFGIAFDVRTSTRALADLDVLRSVEAEGWRLEHAGFVFQPTVSVSREHIFSSGETEYVHGQLVGIYLFRAAETATGQSAES